MDSESLGGGADAPPFCGELPAMGGNGAGIGLCHGMGNLFASARARCCGQHATDLAETLNQASKNFALVQNFSTRLAEAIVRSRKSKGALAQSQGVALSTVSRWLGGSMPDAERIPSIASFLGADAKWLLTGEAGDANGGRDDGVLRDEPATSSGYGRRREPAEPAPSLESSIARIAAALERIATALEDKPPPPTHEP